MMILGKRKEFVNFNPIFQNTSKKNWSPSFSSIKIFVHLLALYRLFIIMKNKLTDNDSYKREKSFVDFLVYILRTTDLSIPKTSLLYVISLIGDNKINHSY